MKKENIIHNQSQYKQMTAEESTQMAIIAQKSLYKEKYRHALKSLSKMKIYEYYGTNPDWSAKDILLNVMKEYNPNLPSVVLIEMTQFILNEWESIKSSKKELILA
jgi:hypothetical protein